MSKKATQLQQHKVQIELDREGVDGEISYASALREDVSSVRGVVGLLFDLCKTNTKIDAVHLNGLLRMVDDTLDEVEDLANGLRVFVETLESVSEVMIACDSKEKVGLQLVPSTKGE